MPKNKMLTILSVIFGLLFFFCCCKVTSILITSAREKSAFDALADTVVQTDVDALSPAASQDAVSDSSVWRILPEYAGIYEQNSDFFAWLSIDGTSINYPVMNTPGEPQYYLSRAFDKKSSHSGTPFLDSDCTEDGGIYIVYGHHMSNGSMFGSLPEYADRAYWTEHKIIRFDTLYERGEYEVIAAFFSRIYGPSQKGFRYYEYTDLSSEVTFNSFIEQVTESALYDTGVTAEYGDRLLVLSTCNYHTKDGRFVVVARKE